MFVNKGIIRDVIIVILPLIVNDLSDHANSIFFFVLLLIASQNK